MCLPHFSAGCSRGAIRFRKKPCRPKPPHAEACSEASMLRRLQPEVLVSHIQLINIWQKLLRFVTTWHASRFVSAIECGCTATVSGRSHGAAEACAISRALHWLRPSVLLGSGFPRLGFICSLRSFPTGRTGAAPCAFPLFPYTDTPADYSPLIPLLRFPTRYSCTQRTDKAHAR